MDQLHEELKEPIPEPEDPNQPVAMDDSPDEDNHSQSDDFQSCESCGSSDRADSECPRVPEDINEAEMLISEQNQNNKDWQKEKNLINNLYRVGSHADLDKDVDTSSETRPIISSQGAIKAQGRTTGEHFGLLYTAFFWDHLFQPRIKAKRHVFGEQGNLITHCSMLSYVNVKFG